MKRQRTRDEDERVRAANPAVRRPERSDLMIRTSELGGSRVHLQDSAPTRLGRLILLLVQQVVQLKGSAAQVGRARRK